MPRNLRRPSPAELVQNKIDRALVDGVGGMQFTAQAPPGVGRLIRLPFYIENQTANYNALIGQAIAAILPPGTASRVYPVIRFLSTLVGGGNEAILRTPQISWALLRVVGFEANVLYQPVPTTPVVEVCFRDLKIGGGATLFVHEDYAAAGIYLMGQDSFAGLRDYPLLRSPNQAEVTTQCVADLAAREAIFSCNLVCEIVEDDNYGQHVPGPYARAGALVRQGGSFIAP